MATYVFEVSIIISGSCCSGQRQMHLKSLTFPCHENTDISRTDESVFKSKHLSSPQIRITGMDYQHRSYLLHLWLKGLLGTVNV